MDTFTPERRRIRTDFNLHGEEWVDSYEWIRDDIVPVLKAEEQYADTNLADLEPSTTSLIRSSRDEFLAQEFGLPQKQDGWWFTPDLPPGNRYPRILRHRASDVIPPPRPADTPSGWEVVIDFNKVINEDNIGVGSVQMSPCGRFVVWTEDPSGRERYRLRIRKIGEEEDITVPIENISPNVVFGPDGEHFYLVGLDEKNRPDSVIRYETSAPLNSEYILRENDERYRIRIVKSSSGDFLFITSSARSITKNYYVRLNSGPRVLRHIEELYGDESASCSHVSFTSGDALLLTLMSPSAPNGQLVLVPFLGGDTLPPRTQWQVLLHHSSSSRLSPAVVLEQYVLVGSRVDGDDTIYCAAILAATGSIGTFSAISPWCDSDARLAMLPEWTATEILVVRTSFVTNEQLFVVQLDIPNVAVPADPKAAKRPTEYIEERRIAVSADGQHVPITVLRRSDTKVCAPTLLTGYGAYDASFQRKYNPMLLRLLDEGMVYAIAHVRGGGERGAQWHDAATGLNKPRSFEDFVACRDELVEMNVSDSKRIVAIGGSAGGLLVAASLNLRPEAFCGVVADVPFVDPLTTMMKPELPLTISDRREWGDPLTSAAIARCMSSYSPYHNVKSTQYPPVLALCGTDDSRVSPVEAAKWISALRYSAKGGPFILRSRSGGHSGSSSVDSGLFDIALQYSWIAKRLGIDLAVEPTPINLKRSGM